MTQIIFILVTLALFIGFIILTKYEIQRGMRVGAPYRERLDRAVGRAEFIIENVNVGAFLHDEVRHLASRVGHSIVHLSLIAVRATERALTNLVRHMRSRPESDVASRETAREFVKTLSDFKDNLKATHPVIDIPSNETRSEISDIH